MPTISISTEKLRDGLETDLTVDDLEEELAQLGTDVESIDDETTKVEIFPNRPDLLSSPGLLRNLRGLLDEETGLVDYPVHDSEYTVSVSEDVQGVRGRTACAIIKGLSLDQDDLDELITLQEKLHVTYGREREECAIGLYPLDKLSFPITYTALKPDDIAFTPLGSKTEQSAQTILSTHEKGEEYQELLADKSKYPVFQDSTGSFLSLPPIINSQHTGRVTTSTTDLFIESSGHDLETVLRALNIVCAHLSDDGGSVHEVSIEYPDETVRTPSIDDVDTTSVSTTKVNDWLGTDLSADTMTRMLGRMRHGVETSEDGETINVSNPKYRVDMIGTSDVIEDVAIGYGFNEVGTDEGRDHTNGVQSRETRFENKIRSYMIGAGFQEVYTFSLTNASTAADLSAKKPVELSNTVSDTYNALRCSIIPEHLDVLQSNAHYSYPQQLFEVGRVFTEDASQQTGVREKTHLCLTVSGSENSFSMIQGLLQGLEERFGCAVEVKEHSHPAMIDGRTAALITNSDIIGVFGELHPSVLDDFDVKQPTSAGEIDLRPIITN
jgi:phenylalanyl-tRNA synthetase beta chain